MPEVGQPSLRDSQADQATLGPIDAEQQMYQKSTGTLGPIDAEQQMYQKSTGDIKQYNNVIIF
jgi:hypothetical protein